MPRGPHPVIVSLRVDFFTTPSRAPILPSLILERKIYGQFIHIPIYLPMTINEK